MKNPKIKQILAYDAVFSENLPSKTHAVNSETKTNFENIDRIFKTRLAKQMRVICSAYW